MPFDSRIKHTTVSKTYKYTTATAAIVTQLVSYTSVVASPKYARVTIQPFLLTWQMIVKLTLDWMLVVAMIAVTPWKRMMGKKTKRGENIDNYLQSVVGN